MVGNDDGGLLLVGALPLHLPYHTAFCRYFEVFTHLFSRWCVGVGVDGDEAVLGVF